MTTENQTPIKPENLIIYNRMLLHPLTAFDEKYFLDLLEYSLSLSVSEKRRVIDAIPTLSQFQIDELHKVFIDERDEFKKLLTKERDTIRDLVKKASDGWKQLIDIYTQEEESFRKLQEDQTKLDSLRSALDDE